MTKLEEVARALCVGNDSISACCGECGVKLEQARAALLALREPSEGMREAGYAAACLHDNGDTVPSLEIAPAAWQSMIDHILSEAP